MHFHGINQKVESLESSVETESSKRGKKESSPSMQNLLKNWPLTSAIILYCIFCLDEMAFSEVVFQIASLFLNFNVEGNSLNL